MDRSDPQDGGPAFPQNEFCFAAPSRDGMSLRDWFAGQALASIARLTPAFSPDTMEREQARRCYALADAMLAVRAKGSE